jgi:uncharacterized protein (UPF0548 family)
MLLIRKPSPEKISAFLERQRRLEFTYRPVGHLASVSPPGFNTDHTRIPLGEGIDAFNAAKQALRNWKQFDLGWLSAWPQNTPIQDDEVIANVAQFGPVSWLNACRIVYVIDEDCWFGFAYGTLPDHAASGQERFMLRIWQGLSAGDIAGNSLSSRSKAFAGINAD